MTTPPDLPTLDALHALSTPGEWTEADTKFMAALRNAYPALSARIFPVKTESERVGKVTAAEAQEAIGRFNNSHWGTRGEKARYSIPARPEYDDDIRLSAYVDQAEARIALLEETLRGIRQEKERDREAAIGLEASHEELDQQIAWIDRVLRGEL